MLEGWPGAIRAGGEGSRCDRGLGGQVPGPAVPHRLGPGQPLGICDRATMGEWDTSSSLLPGPAQPGSNHRLVPPAPGLIPSTCGQEGIHLSQGTGLALEPLRAAGWGGGGGEGPGGSMSLSLCPGSLGPRGSRHGGLLAAGTPAALQPPLPFPRPSPVPYLPSAPGVAGGAQPWVGPRPLGPVGGGRRGAGGSVPPMEEAWGRLPATLRRQPRRRGWQHPPRRWPGNAEREADARPVPVPGGGCRAGQAHPRRRAQPGSPGEVRVPAAPLPLHSRATLRMLLPCLGAAGSGPWGPAAPSLGERAATERGPEGPRSMGRPSPIPWPGNGWLLHGRRERSCFRHEVPSGEGSAHPSLMEPSVSPTGQGFRGAKKCSVPPAHARPPCPTPVPQGARAGCTWGPQHLPEPGWAQLSPCHIPLCAGSPQPLPNPPHTACRPCRGISSSPEGQQLPETPSLPRAEGGLAARIPPQHGQDKPPSTCTAGQRAAVSTHHGRQRLWGQ